MIIILSYHAPFSPTIYQVHALSPLGLHAAIENKATSIAAFHFHRAATATRVSSSASLALSLHPLITVVQSNRSVH